MESSLVACAEQRTDAGLRMLGGKLSQVALIFRNASVVLHRSKTAEFAIWHRSPDTIVKLSNAEGSIRQWVDVHGLFATSPYEQKVRQHIRRAWGWRAGYRSD